MLVIQRKVEERVFLGDDICITVVRLRDGTVRLGIDAPREVGIVRDEIADEALVAKWDRHHGRNPNGRHGR